MVVMTRTRASGDYARVFQPARLSYVGPFIERTDGEKYWSGVRSDGPECELLSHVIRNEGFYKGVSKRKLMEVYRW